MDSQGLRVPVEGEEHRSGLRASLSPSNVHLLCPSLLWLLVLVEEEDQ